MISAHHNVSLIHTRLACMLAYDERYGYRMGYNGMSSTDIFGTTWKHARYHNCSYILEKAVVGQDWQMHRADMMKYQTSIGLKRMRNQKSSSGGGSCYATDVLQSLRGSPNRDIANSRCPDCLFQPSKLVYTSKHTYGNLLIISCELGLTDGCRPDLRCVRPPCDPPFEIFLVV